MQTISLHTNDIKQSTRVCSSPKRSSERFSTRPAGSSVGGPLHFASPIFSNPEVPGPRLLGKSSRAIRPRPPLYLFRNTLRTRDLFCDFAIGTEYKLSESFFSCPFPNVGPSRSVWFPDYRARRSLSSRVFVITGAYRSRAWQSGYCRNTQELGLSCKTHLGMATYDKTLRAGVDWSRMQLSEMHTTGVYSPSRFTKSMYLSHIVTSTTAGHERTNQNTSFTNPCLVPDDRSLLPVSPLLVRLVFFPLSSSLSVSLA